MNERGQRPQDDVEHAEAARAAMAGHFRAQRRIAVHVLDVAGERGIGVVDDGAIQPAGVAIALQLNVLVNGALFHTPAPAPKQSQLAIRPEAAELDPATEEQVLARNVKASFTGPKC